MFYKAEDKKMETKSREEHASWRCTKCGEKNVPENEFCVKCGGGKNAENETIQVEKKSNKKQVALIVAGMLIVLMIVGGFFLRDHNMKKVARNYVLAEAVSFADLVESINYLDTESLDSGEEGYSSDDIDIALKKAEKEKDRVENAEARLKVAIEENQKRETNKLVSGLDKLIDDYHEAERNLLSEYKIFTDYYIAITEEYKTFGNEMNKLANSFMLVSSPQDLKNSLTASKSAVDQSIEGFKKVKPIDGFGEFHEEVIYNFEKLSVILKRVVGAIDKEDLIEFEHSVHQLDELMSSEKGYKNEIDYFLEKKHEEFINLRKKAEKVENELLVNKTNLNLEIEEINIEIW